MNPPNIDLERSLWKQGYKYIAGIDEVGRGSWAGPVVAAGVILPQNFTPPSVFGDSKQLKPRQREELSKLIKESAIACSVCEVGVTNINRVGIGKASQIAFRKAVKFLKTADYILVDAFYIKHLNKKNQMPIKGGDQISASIAAASVIAKVYRDKIMRRVSKIYPEYGFAKNKGYGTKFHQIAIKTYGLSKIHRKNYNLKFLSI